ncbi:hypothetical protein OSS47_28245 [Pseudomonas citronellolis]|uniref:phage head spike fiber domain-containing protein n=1 Tax=Pseudomonas citronellolis TaxID=53408 RepID=UPI00226E8D5A|nr:hypothetical protein [Pseudomonas citronellolis]WAB91960.1 hypothetical protein OSS47_28245 [Pseudomonas citronellolis]
MGAALKPLLKRLAVGSPAALPTLDLDFLAQSYKVSDGAGGMNSVAFADLITFTRSSAAWRFNASGVLEQVPANQPRFDYDPVTLELRGLLVEEQRTNLLLNSVLAGGTAGTNSGEAVPPTGWQLGFAGSGGVVGYPAVYGLTGLRTAAASSSERPFIARSVTLSANTNYVASARVSAVVGAVPVGAIIRWDNLPGGNSQSGLLVNGVSVPATTNVAVGDVIAAVVSINATGGNGFARFGMGANGNQLVPGDVTLVACNAEVGLFPTSYIPTTSAQVTRAADVASVNTLSPWFNPNEGTLFVDAVAAGLPVGTAAMCSVSLTSGASINERLLALQFGSTYFRAGGVGSGGIDTAVLTMAGAPVAGTNYRAAIAFGLNDARGAVNGTPSSQDTSTPVPAVTTMNIGRLGVSNQPFNGHIRRIRYWPRRLFDNELQRITA